jgi:D-glycero-alpha-D-manno-heptose-7-phosphate kinase
VDPGVGQAPLRVHARAPVRIDFAGGWTDVPDFAGPEGGIVVNAAIARHIDVDFLLGGKTIRLRAEDTGEHVDVGSAAALTYDGTLDLHKAALNLLPVGGVEILSRTDLPRGSGLGGSGALDVALVAGLARCRREMYDPVELAELGFQLEAGELGLAGGRQDQYAAALGGMHELTFNGGGVTARALNVSDEAVADLGRHALLVYTGQSHFSSQTHGRVWRAFAAGDAAVTEALRAIRDVASSAGAAIEAADWRSLAALVDENWRQQRRLDATIATPGTQAVEDAARGAGAWGLKATGAGAGGCFVMLADPADHAAIRTAVESCRARVLDFSFTFDGIAVQETEDDDAD